MIYFIGGVTRAGKSIISKKISVRFGFNYMSLDHLMRAGVNLSKELKDNHDDYSKAQDLECLVIPFLESMINNETSDFIIEGVSLTPESAFELANKYPKKIKFCWCGYGYSSVGDKLESIINYQNNLSCDERCWLKGKNVTFIENIVRYGIEYSKFLRDKCLSLGIPFVECHDFNDIESSVIKAFNIPNGDKPLHVSDSICSNYVTIDICRADRNMNTGSDYYLKYEFEGDVNLWHQLPIEYLRIPNVIVINCDSDEILFKNKYWISSRRSRTIFKTKNMIAIYP